MDSKTSDLLISAWRKKRLAAVHIDLQIMYGHGNERTFQAVGNFAEGLRQYDIPNVWVTFPTFKVPKIIQPGITTVAAFNREALDPNHYSESVISDNVGALPTETVIIKNWGSAFDNDPKAYLQPYLEDNKIDTVIIDGVSGDRCVAWTISDGTNFDKYDFIAAEDCINLPESTGYREHIAKGVKDLSAFQRRFHQATSSSVLSAIESCAQTLSRAPTPSILQSIMQATPFSFPKLSLPVPEQLPT